MFSLLFYLRQRIIKETRQVLIKGSLVSLIGLTSVGAIIDSCGTTSTLGLPPLLEHARRGVYANRRRRRQSAETGTGGTIAASYSRFSSNLQRDESNADQQRTCREAAERNGHEILPEFEFADAAVSGTKRRRRGLDAMLAAAEARKFQVLYFHSLSRLARESVITMPMLKRLVHVHKVRIISVTEGIDSDRDNWELIASILSVMHERYVKELAENVFRGQEGALLEDFCLGDYRLGYRSEPIPGSESGRTGRNPRPRMRYVIDTVAEPWVLRIFYWFVKERRSIRWIVRELNRLGAPKDHRSTTSEWRHAYVVGVLTSEKYIGVWRWGELKNTRDPETGQIRQEPRPEEECGKWTRDFEHLRIIDDETFQKAQELLEENYQKYAAHRRNDGKLNWSQCGSAPNAPRHLLSQLIECVDCGRKFVVGGSSGKYMFCPGYKMGLCGCQTQLRRDRAERMILDVVGQRILRNSDWIDAAYASLCRSWKARQQQVPSELAAARRELGDVEQFISRLLDRIEQGVDDPAIKERLEQRRQRRRELADRVKELEKSAADIGPAPARDWLVQQLKDLGQRLVCDTPAAAYALRDLVGGVISVSEIRREGKKRHFLRGSFAIHVTDTANAVSNGHLESDGELVEQIVIDFVDPNPLDAKAMDAKKLYDDGLLKLEIAERLGCSRSQITKLLKHAHKMLGIEMPDAHAHRATLAKKHRNPPLFEQISEPAMELFQNGLLIDEIADELGYDRATVKKGINLAHERQGLEVPDGRSRRKLLERKVRRTKDDDQPRDEAA